MQRAAVMSLGSEIDADDLAITRRHEASEARTNPEGRAIPLPDQGLPLDVIIGEAIRHTLEITGGNRSQAARILGIARPTLLRKIRAYGLESEGLPS